MAQREKYVHFDAFGPGDLYMLMHMDAFGMIWIMCHSKNH